MLKSRVISVSYWVIFITIVLVGFFKLATPFITIFFALLALNLFKFFNKQWLAVSLFLVLVTAIFYGFIFFVHESIGTLPKIAETAIPIVNKFATEHGIDFGITDVDGLKVQVARSLTHELEGVARFAEVATKEFVYLIIGLVVAISIFLSGKFDLNAKNYQIENNLYTLVGEEISTRFTNFYTSFCTVMGAQLVISGINTLTTGVFVTIIGLPYAHTVIILTFLCGLFPIIGNIISNTIITFIAVTVSPNLAIAALVFLIALHKFEYFLNSKIIGGRIKNPMWLTLLSLLIGEKLMGIPGMILAPVILHYVKMECSKIEVKIS